MNKMEEVELLQEEGKFSVNKDTKRIIIACCVIFAILFIVLLIYLGFSEKSETLNSNKNEFLYSLPQKYYITNEWATPSNDDFNRTSSSLFAIISLLESFYRKQGIEKGFLDKSKIVKFSPDYFLDYLTEYCQNNPLNRNCRKSPDFTFSDYISLLKGMDDPGKLLVPETAYPYQETKDMTGFQKVTSNIIKNNPFHFTIKNITFRSTIDTIKELLYSKKGPIEITLPMPEPRYWYSCDFNDYIKQSEWCLRGTSKIAPFHYKWEKQDDSTSIYHLTGETTITNAREMLLVGYDDNLIEELPVNVTNAPPTKGAFIIKNSWGSTGHSLEYLSGMIGPVSEFNLCPNNQDPLNCIPIDLQCYEKYGIDSSKCLNPTKLECNLDDNLGVCYKELTYYIVADPASQKPLLQYYDTGVNVPLLVYELADGSFSNPTPFLNAPYEFLNNAFRAKYAKQNNDAHCGYLVMSYDAIEQIIKASGPQTDSLSSISLDIEFSDDSYAKSNTKGVSYSLTKNSTYDFQLYEMSVNFADL